MNEDLTKKRCVPCEGGVAKLNESQAQQQLAKLDKQWQLKDGATKLVRECRFVDYYRVMSFVNALAHIANQENHHPDLEVGYNRVLITWTTHAIHGLSENDFICAAKTDLLLVA